MNNNEDKKGPAVKCPPPLIFLALLLIAFAMQQILPLNLGLPQQLKYAGLLLMALALMALLATLAAFVRAKTSIEPWKPSTKIITTGLYAFSRNPIYVAFCLLCIGLGGFADSFWVIISFLPAALLVYFIVIKKEEAYLQQKFGAEYARYKRSVRRWL